MTSKRSRCFAIVALIVFLFVFGACSKGNESQREEARPSTQQAAEAIRDIGKKPIDKAKAAQELGDERARAIDAAVGNSGQ